MSRHLTLRISDAEHQFLEQIAREKQITKTAAARHLFMQNIALDAVQNAVQNAIEKLLETRLAGVEKRLDFLSEKVGQSASRDDLIKAVNFLKESKK